MELIFGLLPLPVAVVALVAIGVTTLLVRRFSKNGVLNAAADHVAAAALTRKRVDQTVEAILAALRMDPVLADKIGDLIAEVVVVIMGGKAQEGKRAKSGATAVIGSAIHNSDVDPLVATSLVTGPTPLNDLIIRYADDSSGADIAFRKEVAAGIVRKYADGAVPMSKRLGR